MAAFGKFIGGVASGGAVAALTLVVVSQLSEPRAPAADPVLASERMENPQTVQPKVADPETVAVAEPVSSGARAEPETVVVAVPAPEPQPAPDSAAEVVADAPAVSEPEAARQPDAVAAKPATVEATRDSQPEVAAAAPEVDAGADGAPKVVANELATAAPGNEATPEPAAEQQIAALPETPPALPATELPAQSAPDSGDAAPVPVAEAAATLTAQLPAPPAPPGVDAAPANAELPPTPPLTPEEQAILADPAQPVLPAAPEAEVAEADVLAPEQTAEPETAAVEEPAVASPVIVAPEPPPVAAVTVIDPPSVATVDSAPATLAPDESIVAGGSSTLPATPRLVTVGEAGLAEEAPQTQAPDAGALPEVALTDGPALQRFAARFANADGKPLFGILLFDSGDAALDRQSVASLPFPVSIVIDPLAPEAAAHAALYRAGGKEVVMLASGIPEGATPADLEQTFEAHAAALPEAVAVIDSGEGAFQNDRALSTQIVPILAEQGRGLLTWDRGLNAADQVARREGLPTSMIFRQIDAEGEDVPVMRRYLDRAAFKAAQEGRAIVVGELRAETIAAILEWTIEGRASTVALAPASALLLNP